jgi:hypothetical protein
MPNLTISDEVYQRLSERAAALHVTVEELVIPALDRLANASEQESDEDPAAKAEAAAFQAHLLNFPRFDGEFCIERDRDYGREVEV